MSIYSQLFKAVKMPEQQPDEDDKNFILRLLRAIALLPEDDWNSLTQKAQIWYTDAVAAHNLTPPLPIPPCPGYEGRKVITVTEVEESKKPLRTTLNKLKKKKGALNSIREAILLNPSWSNSEVYHHVLKTWPGTKPETVAVNSSDIRHTLDLAKKLGWIPPDENKNEVVAKEIA